MKNLGPFWKNKVDFDILFAGQNAQVEEANYLRQVECGTEIVAVEEGVTVQQDWWSGIFTNEQREEALEAKRDWDFANIWPLSGEKDRSVYWS